MMTGLPPVARFASVLMSALETDRKFNGSFAILYCTFWPPPQDSNVIIHLPSLVWTTLGMPGRPAPIWLTPATVWVFPTTSAYATLHAVPVSPFHWRCAIT